MEREKVVVDAEKLAELALAFAAQNGKLLLMREMGVFDDFWRDDITEMVNRSFELTPFVMDILTSLNVLQPDAENVLDEAIKATKH